MKKAELKKHYLSIAFAAAAALFCGVIPITKKKYERIFE